MSTAERSASSWPTNRGFGTYLEHSLLVLQREVPAAYVWLCRVLAPREVLLEVDGESVVLASSRDCIRLGIRSSTPRVRVKTSSPTILGVIDGTSTLMEEVLADRLFLQGACSDLLAFHDGLVAYVHGAVRAPSFPQVLRAYRTGCRRSARIR
jgi:hypothetical protein